MSFFETEASIAKDPLVGLIKQAGTDESPDKLVAVAGVAKHDDGVLMVPNSVSQAARELTEEGINLEYSPSSGIPELGDALLGEILGQKVKKSLETIGVHTSSVVATGGTNAISATLEACTNKDDVMITHSPHWPGYTSIALGIGRKAPITFEMLDDEGEFNFKSFEKVVGDFLEKNPEKKLVLVLNTPFDNPLGKDFGDKAWEEIAIFLSRYSDREILIVLDTAYIDFGPGGKDYRRLNFLGNLFTKVNSPNFNLVIGGSVSKSFAMYGARVGVASLLSANQDNVAQWKDVVGGVIRGTYSNSTRFSQMLALNVIKDAKKLADVHDFQMKAVEMIEKRKEAFIHSLMEKAPDCDATVSHRDQKVIKLSDDITLIKPDGGFFTTLKLSSEKVAQKISDALLAEHVYIPVVSGLYLRIPNCALKEETLDKLAEKIFS